ncbi:MAG: hypothetical protein EBR49_17470 [Betaproteobacteria bacterium]|nr:hypothetical protein [Betaproteobacteria bacterium]
MFLYFLGGLTVGIAAAYWRNRYLQRQRRRIPSVWPLKVRPMVNSRERKVWLWLTKVMFDQQVLVKLPVTRYTVPSRQTEATHWYKLLNGVYCTFTVCGLDGKVIGCVDVPGAGGLSLGNQTLKHTLLEQCNVRYWVVDPDNLPHLTQIRTAFLGEHAAMVANDKQLDTRFQNVREHLQAAVTRRRQSKSAEGSTSGFTPLSSGEFQESRLASGWELNSFVSPLDSRMDKLQ